MSPPWVALKIPFQAQICIWMAVLKTQLGLAKALALAFSPERLQNPGQSGFAKQKNCGEVKWAGNQSSV